MTRYEIKANSSVSARLMESPFANLVGVTINNKLGQKWSFILSISIYTVTNTFKLYKLFFAYFQVFG